METPAIAVQAEPMTAVESLRELASKGEKARGGSGASSDAARFEKVYSGKMPPREQPTADYTESLVSQYEAVRDGRAGPLPEKAKRYRYLHVGGLCWDAVSDYFSPNIGRLRSLGLKAQRVRTDPLGTSVANAEIIRSAVEDSDEPVVFFTHSQGLLHVLKAAELYPEILAKISRVVAIQAPYFGTHLADLFYSRPLLHNIGLYLARLVNPQRFFRTNPFFRGETIRELSKAERGSIPRQRPELRDRVKLYSVVSRVSSRTPLRLVSWLSSGIAKLISGKDTDGLLTPQDGIVPGSRYAWLEDVTHLDLISESSWWRLKFMLGVKGQHPTFAADMTEAMVRWILARDKK